MTDTPPTYLLALDTATSRLAIALGQLDKPPSAKDLAISDLTLLESADQDAPRQANMRLLPAIDELMGFSTIAKQQLGAVVCGLGPGSFTGVRIALASAKGIARGLGLPLFGACTLDAVAWQAWASGLRGRVAVVADAMRHEVYPARYELDDGGVARLDAITVSKADAIVERWRSYGTALVLLGDGLEKYAPDFADDASGLFTLADEQLWAPTGHGLLLAFVAAQRERRQSGEAGAVLPIYTRLSDAEENERLRLASGGQIAQGAEVEVPPSGVSELGVAGGGGGAGAAAAGAGAAGAAAPAPALHLRPMAMQDVPAVAELEARCFAASPASGECWSESAFRAELYAADRSWWVAWLGQELAGFAGGWLIDGNLQVLDVAVDERHRRQGIGRALLMRLLDDARALGAETASLEVRASNAAAIALYEGLGFKQQGRRPGYYSPLPLDKDAPAAPGAPAPGVREDALVLGLELGAGVASPGGLASGAGQHASSTASKRPSPLILAIETSCDETAAAIIDGQGRLAANVVASQVDYHARFGGVVPEIASRKHTEAIVGVVDEAMELAGLTSWQSLDALAVTYAPGLIGALVVGVAFAKGLSWATGLPLIRVNHLEGHIYANRLGLVDGTQGTQGTQGDGTQGDSPFGLTELSSSVNPKGLSPWVPSATGSEPAYGLLPIPQPPFVAALLSGGHTMLVEVSGWGSYRLLGQTLDDAVGEAFDKVAKALGLGYPGGPAISRLAAQGDPQAIDFPRAMLRSHDLSFSLSGLKTAVITYIRQQQQDGVQVDLADVAASFQQAVIDVQVAKALTACQQVGAGVFCLGGGVAANQALREAYTQVLGAAGIEVFYPPLELCSDNAAMIAAVALDRYARQAFMPLDGDASAGSDLSQVY